VNALVDVGELLKIDQEERDNAGSQAAKGGIMSMFQKNKSDGTMSRKEKREHEKTLKEFKKAVYLLEKDSEELREANENQNEYNSLIPWAKLFLGIISCLLSLLWVLQICLYVLPANPASAFLNSYLEFWRIFPLFGFLTVAAFNIYALFCAIKGCFKFGLRFLWFSLYPMEYNKTYMSAFLFNTGLILLCVAPVVQLSVEAFGSYAANSAASLLFLTQLKYLEFFRYFYENNVFIYVFLILSLLTTVYLIFRPRESSRSALELRDRLKAR
jgi:LMBR1 domain-containing protein 1